jgi:hypothetical protein
VNEQRPGAQSEPEQESSFQRPDARVPRVICLVGWGRSGSTLLGNILGELRGCVHVGEIHDLWSAYAHRFECGCGLALPDCQFWAQVACADPTVGRALQSASDVHRTRARHMRVRYVLRMLREVRPGQPSRSPLDAYSELACRLFRSVAAAANADIVVDSTKSPAAAALLLRMPLRVSFIHLVRDPRATGFSWRRSRNADPGGTRHQNRIGYGHNAASWLYWNACAEVIRRRVDPANWLRIRYEDFVSDPEGVLRQVTDKFELPTTNWPLHDCVVRLGTHHTVEGNPSRFKTGPRQIRGDDEWSQRMSKPARAVSVAITAPLFIAYGYHRRTRLPGTVPTHRTCW